MSKIIPALFFLLALLSCERGSEKKQYTLKGQLVKSCEDPMGVANVRLGLLRVDKGQAMLGGSGVEWLAHTRTDAGGHFELTYEGDIKADFYLQYYPDIGSMLLMGIPKNKDLDLGLVYYGRQEVEIEIEVESPGKTTKDDTLKMGGVASIDINNFSEIREIPGPFQKGQVLVNIKDYEGTVQVYSPGPEFFFKNIDPDYFHNFFFYLNQNIGNIRDYRFVTTPCERNLFKISLDSLEVK